MAINEGLLGERERFLHVIEGSYGSDPGLTSGHVIGVNMKITPQFNQNFMDILNNGGDSRTIVDKVAGGLSLPYTVEYNPVDWRFLKYLFDIDSETGSDPYTHNISIGSTHESFTSEWAMQHTTPVIFKLLGNVVTSYDIQFQKSTGDSSEGFVKCTANLLAQDYTNPGSLTAGDYTTSLAPFQFRHFKLTLASSEVVEVNRGGLTITTGINESDSRYANTTLARKIGEPVPGVVRISGFVNVNLFDDTYQTLWATADAMTGTNTLEFTQSASNKITFTLTGVHVAPVPFDGTNIDGVNTGTFTFTATGISAVAIDSIANW